MPTLIRLLVRAIQPLGKSPSDCAEFMCEPLLSEKTSSNFRLIGQNAEPVKVTAKHDEALNVVWKSTKEVISRVLGSFGN